MYRPNRIGPWPIYNSLSAARVMSSSSRFTASSGVGISVRPAPINVLVGDRNDGLFAFRALSLGNLSNNCVCPSIMLTSDYDDVPDDGLMVSLSGAVNVYHDTGNQSLSVDLVFGVLGSSVIPSFPRAVLAGSGSYRVMPANKYYFECPSGSFNCFHAGASWNGSIIVPGGHTNPFYFGALVRNYTSFSVTGIDIEGTLSASVYRGDLDVFDPVR